MRKQFVIAVFALFVVSANAQKKPNLSFQAEIANRNGDTIKILNRNDGKEVRKIGINKQGIFKDSFAVEEGIYMLFDGKEYTQMYLKNSYNLKLKMDAKNFDESIVYSGAGSNENNYLAQSAVSESKYDYNSLLALNKEEFDKRLVEKKTADNLKLDSKKLDPNFVALQKKNEEKSLAGLSKYHNQILEANKLNGSASPTFDYENHKGGKTKLEDFKGKFVYIDVWATWCGPCRAEIPSLKKVEEKYHGKNIEFVSISIDTAKDHEKWKGFVTEKQLGGVQLFADKDWSSDFIKAYGVTGIPRFILIDPSGKIVKADAARPSSPDLQKQLDSLLN
ncbi:TlpA family protein disulfide reductase [Flavobacterium sp.]|jgi:thiol-disulfide isomerase/thioredoxin|uniref:TlpA family protein disulfide reductase n=1 Tax=Flavobacterium sp. TaxID=239 RepID=UPI0037C18079